MSNEVAFLGTLCDRHTWCKDIRHNQVIGYQNGPGSAVQSALWLRVDYNIVPYSGRPGYEASCSQPRTQDGLSTGQCTHAGGG